MQISIANNFKLVGIYLSQKLSRLRYLFCLSLIRPQLLFAADLVLYFLSNIGHTCDIINRHISKLIFIRRQVAQATKVCLKRSLIRIYNLLWWVFWVRKSSFNSCLFHLKQFCFYFVLFNGIKILFKACEFHVQVLNLRAHMQLEKHRLEFKLIAYSVLHNS